MVTVSELVHDLETVPGMLYLRYDYGFITGVHVARDNSSIELHSFYEHEPLDVATIKTALAGVPEQLMHTPVYGVLDGEREQLKSFNAATQTLF